MGDGGWGRRKKISRVQSRWLHENASRLSGGAHDNWPCKTPRGTGSPARGFAALREIILPRRQPCTGCIPVLETSDMGWKAHATGHGLSSPWVCPAA